MTYRILLIFIITSISHFASGQKINVQAEPTVDKSIVALQLGILNGSVNYEFAVGKYSTIKAEVLVQLGLAANSRQGFQAYLFPLISGESRHYYNLTKRQEVGKRTDRNSGNFIGLQIAYQPQKISNRSGTNPIRFSDYTSVYARWGMKRMCGKHFHFEFAVGPGIVLYELRSNTQGIFSINVDFRIGHAF